jgi:hypothetical protein
MNLIRQADKLAEEFLENCVEEYEIIIATDFKRSDRERFTGTYWDFVGERDGYIDAAQDGVFTFIYDDLDKFLRDKGLVAKPESDEYMVLAHKFTVSKIKALNIAEKLLLGETYDYSNTENTIQISTNEVGMVSSFSLLDDLQWSETSLNIVDNETIEIKARGLVEKYSFPELGFKDKRSDDKPINIWHTLLVFGHQEGVITWKSCNSLKNDKMLKKDVSRIGKKLKDFMGIDESPFHKYHSSRGYKTKFRFHDKRHY